MYVPIFILHDLRKVCDVSAVDCFVGLARQSDYTGEHMQQ